MPLTLVVVLSVWLVVFAASRYVSLASMAAALALPLAAWVTKGSLRMVAISGAIGALAVYKHRANIQRLLNGTEHRFGSKKTPASTGSNS
jgi:glycerol-3-phosphate acyltransferase PlsY